MDTYVLVHGAWHDGDLLIDVADIIRGEGHTVYTPTLMGNKKGDSKINHIVKKIITYFL